MLRRAAVFGSVVASFAIESFGSERLQTLTLPEIEARFGEFRQMTNFEAQPLLVPAAEE